MPFDFYATLNKVKRNLECQVGLQANSVQFYPSKNFGFFCFSRAPSCVLQLANIYPKPEVHNISGPRASAYYYCCTRGLKTKFMS